MSASLDVLSTVQDVDWVVGSFIASASGELLMYQMPAEFGEEELSRTTTRLTSIVRSAEVCGVPVEQCDMSFSRYQLLVNRCAAGMLCVLVEAPVSRTALSMATRIVMAELPGLIAVLEGGNGAEPSQAGSGARLARRTQRVPVGPFPGNPSRAGAAAAHSGSAAATAAPASSRV